MGKEERRENGIMEETAEAFEARLTREVEKTEQTELGLVEDEFLEEFEEDSKNRR